ncbi:tyrosine-type recombinase/integrase [Cupriavidus basilensis]|uniref:tyrosine-type recombinase/integrase n=1 Tax=Cupriavidus basilensis TaxID=68895 RepID=UPI0023E7BFAD|nr:site-specific integrase [Cupriavidus basilensis]MDF3883055.1 site-specific integrase [Cupriavidus basilensis]
MQRSIELVERPFSLAGLSAERRDQAVVSFVEVDGRRVPVSVVTDLCWQLWMHHDAPNVPRSSLIANFTPVPVQFLRGLQDIYYRWWTAGMNGRPRPKATTFVTSFNRIRAFVRWLDERGVRALADVTPLHTATYARMEKSKGITPETLALKLLEVNRLYELREHSTDAILRNPWPSGSPCEVANLGFDEGEKDEYWAGRTKVIPDDILSVLYQYCEKVVANASSILAQRDAGERVLWMDPEVRRIRDAILFLIGITTGMRISEIVAIKPGGYRLDEIDGVTFVWIRSIDFKTGTGEREWMAPIESKDWLSILARWAIPYQDTAERRLSELESWPPRDDASREKIADWHADVKSLNACCELLFLSSGGGANFISTLSTTGANSALKELAKSAGVEWDPETHQMRRTYTVSCARHEFGDIFYLKHQLKHRSLDMTSLYAMNEAQDETLFKEGIDELRLAKSKLIEEWLDPETELAGGAAPVIRASQVATVASRRALAEDISDKVSIRATGHSWCLGMDRGCGGEGLYESTLCIGCKNSLFTKKHEPIWKGILIQQEELEQDEENIGPGGVRRARRDAALAREVLSQLAGTVSELR